MSFTAGFWFLSEKPLNDFSREQDKIRHPVLKGSLCLWQEPGDEGLGGSTGLTPRTDVELAALAAEGNVLAGFLSRQAENTEGFAWGEFGELVAGSVSGSGTDGPKCSRKKGPRSLPDPGSWGRSR